MFTTNAFLTPPLSPKFQSVKTKPFRRSNSLLHSTPVCNAGHPPPSPNSETMTRQTRTRRKPTNWATRTGRPLSPPCNGASEDQIISRIIGCSRRDNWYSAHVAFTQFTSSTAPTARLIGAYVLALSRGGRLDTAREVLDAHAHIGGDTAIARASLVAAIAKQNGADAALHELIAMPPHLWSAHACTSVIHAIGVEGERPHMAIEILRTAKEHGVSVDQGMYDAAMRSLGRAGKVKEAFELLSEMIKDKIRPSDVTFEALIYACAHAHVDVPNVRLGKRAGVVFDAAKSANQLTPRVLSAFASAILRAGIWDDSRVLELINQMSKFAKMGREELRKQGVKLDLFERKLYRIKYLREQTLRVKFENSASNPLRSRAVKQRLKLRNWTPLH